MSGTTQDLASLMTPRTIVIASLRRSMIELATAIHLVWAGPGCSRQTTVNCLEDGMVPETALVREWQACRSALASLDGDR